MDDQRDVRCNVLRVDLAKPGGHIGVEAGNKGNPRRTTQPGGADSCDGDAQEKGEGRHNPADSDAAGHVPDGLNDSLQDADIVLTYGDKQSQSGSDVKQPRHQAAPGYGSRQSLLRAVDFIPHDRSELEAHKTEADDTE